MKLGVLTRNDCEKVRLWRNDALETLRTPYLLTAEMQEKFFEDVICNRNTADKYWSIIDATKKIDAISRFVGMGGIINIQWENRIGEISLIIDPQRRQKGLGVEAVGLLLDQAFNYMNLKTVIGECYGCNEAGCSFWTTVAQGWYRAFTTALPNRKYWNGKYWGSLYFSIDVEDFRQSLKK